MPAQHWAPRLSELDLAVAAAVPPGGNWKDVPESIPLKRLDTIRQSFARGEGSRSTYYGRLHPDRPSYTINTYFGRPGNGCHLHHDAKQLRTISYREAARLQSFPDSFCFEGSRSDWAKQIGNGVPPLLAFQIAECLGAAGSFVDLFSGAGGLGLGFSWAGWEPIVANDVVESFLNTYVKNVHPSAILGDIRDSTVRNQLVEDTQVARRRIGSSRRLAVLGGPPCQGFSTAGRKRTAADERNHLFRDYLSVLDSLQPDVFVFENVTGLLNMDGGSFYRMIVDELGARCDVLNEWVLNTHEFSIPQRRSRVILVGHARDMTVIPPQPKTADPKRNGLLAPWVSVHEALSDLPRLAAGQDGSGLKYRSSASTSYQRLMRGALDVRSYLAGSHTT